MVRVRGLWRVCRRRVLRRLLQLLRWLRSHQALDLFLQLTGAVGTDIAVPGTDFTLGDLQQAQALGDADVLAARGRPVLRVHLLDRAGGLVALAHALGELWPAG